MTMDAEETYRRLGALAATFPVFDPLNHSGQVDDDTAMWLGRLEAVIARTAGMGQNLAKLRMSQMGLSMSTMRAGAINDIKMVLYAALSSAELIAPTSLKGAFIAIGSSFDAFAAIARLISNARQSVLIVDPYMDEKVVTEIVPPTGAGVVVRLLSDSFSVRPGLAPAVRAWTAQYGDKRPIIARLSAPRALHDRAVFIDDTSVWTLGQSFKDLAVRAPTTIVRVDEEAAQLKRAAYEAIWEVATPGA